MSNALGLNRDRLKTSPYLVPVLRLQLAPRLPCLESTLVRRKRPVQDLSLSSYHRRRLRSSSHLRDLRLETRTDLVAIVVVGVPVLILTLKAIAWMISLPAQLFGA